MTTLFARVGAPRTFLLTAAVLALTASIGGPAHAADHPPVLSFDAHRTTGTQVVYSGRYVEWNEERQSYEAPPSGHVSVDFGECATASPALDSDGTFSGVESLYPGASVTASAAFDGNSPSFTSAPVDLPAAAASPVAFQRLQAFTFTRKKVKQVYVSGELFGECAEDLTPGNDGTDGYGMTWTKGKVALQWKVGRVWKTAKSIAFGDDDFSWVVKASKAKSKTWRLVWSGNVDIAAGTSRTFKTLSRPSVEN